MELDDNLKTKIRFHLGYNSGAQMPVGDRARLEEAMSLVPDEYWYKQVVYHVQRCDNVWQISAYVPDDILEVEGSDDYGFSRQERLSGDVQRTINTSDPLKSDEYFREIYLRECDRLAETLYVANYRRPEVRRYAYDRAGSEFVMAIPGPADTAVGSRVVLHRDWR